MKLSFIKSILLLISFFIYSLFVAQCNVSITASSLTVPCGGGNVTLTAVGSGNTTAVLDNDFDLGNAGSGWNVSPAGQFNNPCDPSIDGGTYMWMGNTTAAPRTLETAPLDVSCGGDICFYLDMATQGGAAPCEGPDLTNEGVYLEYSINGGASWVTINYFQPQGGGTSGPFLSWAQYCFTIPVAAQTTATLFHWFQNGSSGTCCDHWGIDNVTITAQNCNTIWYDWAHVPGTTGPTGDNASQTVNVISDSTFVVCYTDGAGFNCCDSVKITVQGMGPAIVDTIGELCLGDNNGQITVTPSGGTPNYTIDISGPSNQTLSGAGAQTFTNLQPGTYNITITDNAACSVTSSAILIQGANCCPMTLTSISSTDNSCHINNSSSCDGTATVIQTGGFGNISYTWYDLSTNTVIPGQTLATATGLCVGTYYVEVTDQTPCTRYDTILVGQAIELTFAFSSFNPSCFGSSDGQAIVIPAGGTQTNGYSYTWTPAGTAPLSSPSAQNLSSGNYSLTITDDNGCTADTIFTIVDPPQITIDAVNLTDETCVGNCTGQIQVVSNIAITYFISGLGVNTSNNTGLFTSLCAGTYTVTIEDANLCTASQTVTIASPSSIILSVSPDTTICIGGIANILATAIGGTGNFTYIWDMGLPNAQTNSVMPTTNTIYNVYAQDANFCISDTLDIIVDLYPPLSVVAFTDTSICAGDSFSISALATGGIGNGYLYTWNQGLGNGISQTVSPITPTTYLVTVTDACETPSSSDQVTISIAPLPQPDFSSDIVDGCVPLDVVFTETTSSSATLCSWSFGDGGTYTGCNSVNYTFDSVGCWDITLIQTSSFGCVDSITYPTMICVYDLPEANFIATPNPASMSSPLVYFNNISSLNSTSYFWEFGTGGSLGQSSQTDPTFTFPLSQPGTYSICLTAITDYACEHTICRTVTVNEEFFIYVPNSFTPNGDGINDEFFPVIEGFTPLSYKMMIFNRWGELISQSENIGKKWNGIDSRNGSESKSDVYVWKIEVRDNVTSELKYFQGHVTLLR